MADKPPPPAGDDDRRIADAELLFGDEAANRPQPEAPRSPEVAPGDDYALEERVEPVRKKVDTVLRRGARRPAGRPARDAGEVLDEGRTRARSSGHGRSSTTRTPSSRSGPEGAEWGRSLAILAAVVVVTGSIFAWSISAGWYTLALVSVLAGGVVFILCSYPILISLERPVRITPEQAVKDFYGSLSHHVPHFRRMWLLLSSAGRTSGHFSTFPEFKGYWVDRLAKLRAGRAGRFTPLKFEVGDFKSDKSQGKTSVDAKYTVNGLDPGPAGRGPHRLLPRRDQPGQGRRTGCGISTRDSSRASELRLVSLRRPGSGRPPTRSGRGRSERRSSRPARTVLTGIARAPPSPAEGEVGDAEERQAEGGIDQEEAAPDGQPEARQLGHLVPRERRNRRRGS